MKKIFFLIFYNVILVFSSDISDIEFGNDNHLDIITWNIEWFPKNGQITLDYVSEILQALDADIIAMQELDDWKSAKTSLEQQISRLEKAKEDGKVLSSKEVFVFSSMFMGVLLLYFSPMLLDDFLKICKSYERFTKRR